MDKYNLSQSDILSKLALIEKHLGRFSRSFYEVSQGFNPYDTISVHGEASRMMKFVGLNTQIPYVAFTKTGEHIGGNIELDNSNDVFIEINEECKSNNDKVLAVMAHEICHKVLYVYGLYFQHNNIENELLTDLATVYVGFGKLSLNGCYNQTEGTHNEWINGKNVEVATTREEHIGYLSRYQFAMAYNICCSVYGVGDDERNKGLRSHSIEALKCVPMYNHTPITQTDIQEKLRFTQHADAAVTRDLVLLENAIGNVKKKIMQRHQQYRNDFVEPFKDDAGIDKQIVAADLMARCGDDLDIQNTKELLDGFLESLSKLNKIDESALLDIECPFCGYRKQKALKENKEIFIKCHNCKYTFVWDGKRLEDAQVDGQIGIVPQGEGLIDKIKKMFNKKRKSKP